MTHAAGRRKAQNRTWNYENLPIEVKFLFGGMGYAALHPHFQWSDRLKFTLQQIPQMKRMALADGGGQIGKLQCGCGKVGHFLPCCI